MPSDAERYLRRFHARRPGATERSIGLGRTRAGQSSYDLLLEHVDGPGAALDVGCGDGGLLARLRARDPDRPCAGCDLSEAELAAARARLGDGVPLAQARGQALPHPSGSFPWVLSHLALMLMPLEASLRELRRVVTEGGTLLAVVQSELPPQGAFGELAARMAAGLEGVAVPEIGDARASDREALDALLGDAGFSQVRYRDVRLRFAPATWSPLFDSLYGVDLLPEAARAHALAATGDEGMMEVRLVRANALARGVSHELTRQEGACDASE
ncbi:MAG TPA: class I SAM-dependent methyltransferase, partial [Polyangiaceae bacterium LLY-WYZ-15_(1-7)]|nr:class I SAM-dependent methyltransferase [Polyangiaceae bacterium LLY-WYZ-15_(1-7)]